MSSVVPDELAARLKNIVHAFPERILVVDTSAQRLKLVHDGKVVRQYPVSTSSLGTGNLEGSFKTPTGIHRICRKVGDGAPTRTIFTMRVDSGVTWDGGDRDDDLVLTRILQLEGLEEGVNKGEGIGSYERNIYIHGTNRESEIGSPASHGCVRMLNEDVVELYDRVDEGTVVVIH